MIKKYKTSVVYDILFNVVLSVIIFLALEFVPTKHIIEPYINIGIYAAPYFYQELMTTEDEMSLIKLIKLISFISILLYCFVCVAFYPYENIHKFIFKRPIYIFGGSFFIALVSIFSNVHEKSSNIKKNMV